MPSVLFQPKNSNSMSERRVGIMCQLRVIVVADFSAGIPMLSCHSFFPLSRVIPFLLGAGANEELHLHLCSVSRMRKMNCLATISLRKALPVCAMPGSSSCLSSAHLKIHRRCPGPFPGRRYHIVVRVIRPRPIRTNSEVELAHIGFQLQVFLMPRRRSCVFDQCF